MFYDKIAKGWIRHTKNMIIFMKMGSSWWIVTKFKTNNYQKILFREI